MKRSLILCLLAILLTAGCQAAESESGTAATPTAVAATNTPQPTLEPTPTATPDPTANNPWWSERVFYEIFVRSFSDSDGDGVGDLQGIIDKLDYLNDGDPNTTTDLGITGIWLMPIQFSPSYHGYDVADYYLVDPEYGNNADFQRLMEEAHKRGIAVIVDLVLNHTSSEHPWFLDSTDPDSEFRDWYVWEDERPPRSGWHSAETGAYYGYFWSEMPDLNYTNPAVTEEMYAVTEFWLDEMGADGFRLDAIKYLVEEGREVENTEGTHQWFADYFAFYKSINPDAFTVGEAWAIAEQTLRYVEDDEVDMVFEFDFAGDLIGSATIGWNDNIAAGHRRLMSFYETGQIGTFISNHDQPRVMTQFNGNEGRARNAAALLLTSPGVPFIYYGEEIGLSGGKPDPNIRTPMQWSAEAGGGFTTGTPWRDFQRDIETANVAVQEDDPDSLLNWYRSLIHLRNDHRALSVGQLDQFESSSANIYAFTRHLGEEAFLIVTNLGKEDVSDYSLALDDGGLSGSFSAETRLGADNPAAITFTDDGSVVDYKPFETIPAQSTHIFQLVAADG